MVTLLRPLSTSELLDRTFHLYRNHFVLFAGIAAMPQVPMLALRIAYSDRAVRSITVGNWLPILLLALAGLVAVEIAHAATVVAVSRLQLERPAGVGGAYSGSKQALFRVVVISFLAFMAPMAVAIPIALVASFVFGAVAVTVGSSYVTAAVVIAILVLAAALILLPLRWWLMWSLAIPVTILEGGGVRVSMRRSKNLTKGRRDRIFVVYLLIVILTSTVGGILQIPFYVIKGIRASHGTTLIGPIARTVQAAGHFVSASLVGALLTIALTLIYYDERVRREGFDMQLMMSALEAAPETPVTSPA